MKILMMTNTYKPIVGGLERSIEAFAKEYRKRGHETMIAAPASTDAPAERDVVRVPAIPNVNGTAFSVRLPIPGALTEALNGFKPDIVHAHHPFLMGATAMRVASKHRVPLVFTHHILFEQNMHYVPGGDTEVIKRFVVELSSGFANLADRVFAPSESVAQMLRERGVETPIDVLPTGIDVERFSGGDGPALRRAKGIPEDAFVVGHIGRLAPEKNLPFLARAVAAYVKRDPSARFLVVGSGPSEEDIVTAFRDAGIEDRLVRAGLLSGKDLIDAYTACDVFAFASQSETQGMVLAEAMAAGVPVVGVDAPGVREIVLDGSNGRLLTHEDETLFADALESVRKLSKEERSAFSASARETAAQFSIGGAAQHALSVYSTLISSRRRRRALTEGGWKKTMRAIKFEWRLVKTFTRSAKDAVIRSDAALVG